MIWLVALCALGIPAGLALLWRTPRLAANSDSRPVSIIIPARNEERNLPKLLGSLQSRPPGTQILVVDDASTDDTPIVARTLGAHVISAPPLAPGWTGKTWACSQGAHAAKTDLLLFVDADTWFEPSGLERLLNCAHQNAAVSILPFHEMHRPYEQLSLFFNLLMAIGAGGFGIAGTPRLFGQSLLVSRELYERAGGHAAVRRHILENLALSSQIESVGAKCVCYVGRGVFHVRMFPDGFGQLCEGWVKAFADGAAASGSLVLALSIVWLTSLCSTFLMLLLAPSSWRVIVAVIYLLLALQLWRFAARVGAYSAVACLLYPLPLVFYFALFGNSLYRRILGQKVQWRGRQI